MALKDEREKAVAAHLRRTWSTAKCPMCRQNEWKIKLHATLTLSDDPRNLAGSGLGLPCAAIICMKCGVTMLVNLGVANALGEESTDG